MNRGRAIPGNCSRVFRRGLVLAGLVSGLLLCGGCETVEPWQRQHLARPEMAWAPDPMEAQLLEQEYFSKEGSSGGGKAAGGGCGCN